MNWVLKPFFIIEHFEDLMILQRREDYMCFNDTGLQTMKEIEEFAMKTKMLMEMKGLTFDVTEFINRVEHTRLTTHMDIRQAFEYESNKL